MVGVAVAKLSCSSSLSTHESSADTVMAELVGLVASIIAVIELSGKTIGYLKQIKDGSTDRTRLRDEIRNIANLLEMLKDRAEDAADGEAWCRSVLALGGPAGPLDQLKTQLERLIAKLALPSNSFRRVTLNLMWPLTKDEVSSILDTVERQKSLFSLALQNDHVNLSKSIKSSVDAMSDQLADVKLSREARIRSEEDQKMLEWIAPINFWTAQNDTLARREDGTGEWMFETPEFKDWAGNGNRLLWCPGIPGAGKTVQTASIIQYLQSQVLRKEIGLAYIYFNYRDVERHTVESCLATFVRQLLQSQDAIPLEARDLFQKHSTSMSRPSVRELSQLLLHIVEAHSQVFFIIDALDECSERPRDMIVRELLLLPPTSRVLCTSRPLPSVEQNLVGAARIEIRAQDKDIETFILAQLVQESRLKKHTDKDPDLARIIIETIAQKAEGMFLLAKLHFDSVAGKQNIKAVKRALENLPTDLDTVYEETLQRIYDHQSEDDRILAERVLTWAIYAKRPLIVEEVQHALITEQSRLSEDIDFFNDNKDPDEELLPDADLMITVCHGLVTVDEESGVIRLVHYTTQEYFERVGLSNVPNPALNITLTCLHYINLTREWCQIEEKFDMQGSFEQYLKKMCGKFPFVDFAYHYWGLYAAGRVENEFPDDIVAHMSWKCDKSIPINAYKQFLSIASYEHLFTDALSHAASFGLVNVISMLLKQGMRINEQDRDANLPIHHAARSGQIETVKYFLCADPDQLEAKGKDSSTPLKLAARGGHHLLVNFLLQYGADVNAADELNETPLHDAASRGDKEVVKILLDAKDVNVNSSSHRRGTPIIEACRYGHQEIVGLLIDSGLGVDLTLQEHGSGRTALHMAAEEGHQAIVETLLSSDELLETVRDSDEFLALDIALYNSKCSIARSLWQGSKHELCGMDVDRQGLWGAILFHDQAEVEHRLENSHIDMNQKDSCGRTILHWATLAENELAVRLILENKSCDVNARDKHGQTAFSWVVLNKKEDISRILLHREELDVDLPCEGRSNSRINSCIKGQSNLFFLHFHHSHQNTSVDAVKQKGKAAILLAAYFEQLWLVELLLERKDIDPNFKGLFGKSALWYCASEGHAALVRRFLEVPSIEILLEDDFGETVLDACKEHKEIHDMIVRKLLEQGYDVSELGVEPTE